MDRRSLLQASLLLPAAPLLGVGPALKKEDKPLCYIEGREATNDRHLALWSIEPEYPYTLAAVTGPLASHELLNEFIFRQAEDRRLFEIAFGHEAVNTNPNMIWPLYNHVDGSWQRFRGYNGPKLKTPLSHQEWLIECSEELGKPLPEGLLTAVQAMGDYQPKYRVERVSETREVVYQVEDELLEVDGDAYLRWLTDQKA